MSNKNSAEDYVAPKQTRTVGSMLGLSQMWMDGWMDEQTDGKSDPSIMPCPKQARQKIRTSKFILTP